MTADAPTPLAGKGRPVDWFFAFKFNCASFPGCNDRGYVPRVGTKGIFGGKVAPYPRGHSQQYVYATSARPRLVKGKGCLGATFDDPLGATFAQVYLTDRFNYLIWNDQFCSDPKEFPKFLSAPWGHSKGMLAWNEEGEGFVLQVSTPSWPASGSKRHPRKTDGNTLGCVRDDNIEVSQHFFCLRINREDLCIILKALSNSSVVTKPDVPQVAKIGGPRNVQNLANKLGVVSGSKSMTMATLSSGVKLLSKPHAIFAPPWQLVSAKLGGLPLRVASWWASPAIYSTTRNSKISCWPSGFGKPGPVEIALTGNWKGESLGFHGIPMPTGNHAKIAVSTDRRRAYSIFGDMNQEGTLSPIIDGGNKDATSPTCAIRQNPRGGLFYVVHDRSLFESMTALLAGQTAPVSTHDA